MPLRFGLCLLLLAALVGCASPGAPQPPSLRLPKPVDDLSAVRKGDKVLLTWTPPTQTSDKENIRDAGKTNICRSIAKAPMVNCGTPVSTLSDVQVAHWTKDTMVSRRDYTDELPASAIEQNPTGEATYAVEDLSVRGRSAGLSNQVQVSLAPTLPAPAGAEAKVAPEGVQLAWIVPTEVPRNPALNFLYRIFRRTEGAKTPEVIAGEVSVYEHPEFLDRNIEWEKTYLYRIAPVTQVQHARTAPTEVEGDDSPILTVDAHDIFPPATPTGLQAVFSGPGQKPFIDLVWAPVADVDLAGYNVYRHEEGSDPVKINTELVKTPAYRDDGIISGKRYLYSVSAVDARGNESTRSEEAGETVP